MSVSTGNTVIIGFGLIAFFTASWIFIKLANKRITKKQQVKQLKASIIAKESQIKSLRKRDVESPIIDKEVKRLLDESEALIAEQNKKSSQESLRSLHKRLINKIELTEAILNLHSKELEARQQISQYPWSSAEATNLLDEFEAIINGISEYEQTPEQQEKDTSRSLSSYSRAEKYDSLPIEAGEKLTRAERKIESIQKSAKNAKHILVYELWADDTSPSRQSVEKFQSKIKDSPDKALDITDDLMIYLRERGGERQLVAEALIPLAVEKPKELVETAPEATPLFIEQLQGPDYRERALDALEAIAAVNPSHLIENLPEENDKRQLVAEALIPLAVEKPKELVETAPEATPLFIEQLQGPDYRERALDALEAIAAVAPEVLEDDVPAIAAAMGDDREEVKLLVCRTLRHIGTDDALARLRDARREFDDYELRSEIEQLIQEAEEERQQATVDASEIQSLVPQPDSSQRLSETSDQDQQLPDHEVLELIGSGGNADVKKVKLTDTETIAALKIPRWQGTLSESVIDEFRTEATTWSRIDDHQNIINVLGSGTIPHPWILLDYMPDGNLRGKLDTEEIQTDTVIDYLTDLCEAIRHAQRHGIVHADLKPENVLFDGDTPKIGDWGLAKVLLEHSTSIEGMTPSYAAPEQLDPDQYGSVDDSTDIYQIGIIAYEMLTGTVPYDRSNPAGTVTSILTDSPTPPTEQNPNLPENVDDIVLTAIAKKKEDRYESILYLRDAFANLGRRAE